MLSCSFLKKMMTLQYIVMRKSPFNITDLGLLLAKDWVKWIKSKVEFGHLLKNLAFWPNPTGIWAILATLMSRGKG